MTQLFKPNVNNKRFFEVFREAKMNNITLDMIAMYREIIGSRALGEVIFDNGLLDLGFDIDREFFIDHYEAIFSAMTNAITLETHRTLIHAILGDSVLVEFTIPKPGHLIVNITEKTKDFGLMSPDGIGLTMTFITSIGSGWAVRPDKGLKARSGRGLAFRSQFRSKTNIGVLLKTVISQYTIEQARNVLEHITTQGVFTEYNFTIGA